MRNLKLLCTESLAILTRPKGDKRLADVTGAAIMAVKIVVGEIEDTSEDDAKTLPRKPTGKKAGRRWLRARRHNGMREHLEGGRENAVLDPIQLDAVRIRETLSVIPAIAAGLTGRLWNREDIIAVMGAAAEPKKRSLYKKPGDEVSNSDTTLSRPPCAFVMEG